MASKTDGPKVEAEGRQWVGAASWELGGLGERCELPIGSKNEKNEMKDCDYSDAITDELLQGHCTSSEVAADWH